MESQSRRVPEPPPFRFCLGNESKIVTVGVLPRRSRDLTRLEQHQCQRKSSEPQPP